MLDVSRHFMNRDMIIRLLDEMARYSSTASTGTSSTVGLALPLEEVPPLDEEGCLPHSK